MAYDNLDAKINAITAIALNNLTQNAVRIFREEMPRKSGQLRDSVKSTPAKKGPDGNYYSDIIITAPYARAVDKGISPEDNQIQTAKNKYMVFSEWPNGPDGLRWADGNFRFHQVKHIARADNYSERALKRIRALGKTSFFSKVKDGIKKFFGIK